VAAVGDSGIQLSIGNSTIYYLSVVENTNNVKQPIVLLVGNGSDHTETMFVESIHTTSHPPEPLLVASHTNLHAENVIKMNQPAAWKVDND
jgi:hypothetical protein